MDNERIAFRCIRCGGPLKPKSPSSAFLECDSKKFLWTTLQHPPYMVSRHFATPSIEAKKEE